MDPKSSHVDTVEEAETELETRRSMELSTDFGSLALEKAEMSEEEEDEDADEDEDEDEEEVEDVDSVESDQEWDVDSFDGVEYNSDPEDSEDWRRYMHQCLKSEGFDVDWDYLPTDPGRIYCGFNPLKLDAYFSPPNITGRQYMENMLKVVIEKYNDTKKKTLVLDHIVRAVGILGGGVKAYITFMAKESPQGELVEYQGKAEYNGRCGRETSIHSSADQPLNREREIDHVEPAIAMIKKPA